MRTLFKKTGILLIALIIAALCSPAVSAGVWEFGTSGSGQNPFTPRGYLIDTGKDIQFISSPFQVSTSSVTYTGTYSGVDYVDAEGPENGCYTFYAMTDRNPWPRNDDYVGAGQLFLFAYENGEQIVDFTGYVETPPTRVSGRDPSGGRSWTFKISGFRLRPGSVYEFGFLCGMQANNGVTLAPAFDANGSPVGYISQPGGEISEEERAQYEAWKYEEYQFVSSWKKAGDGYQVNTVPMRYTLRTYADLSRWEESASEADSFLKSVSDLDLRQGKYKEENLDALRSLLKSLRTAARDQVRYLTQDQAEAEEDRMIQQLEEMFEKARSEKPEPADTAQLDQLIEEAEDLFLRAGSNIGSALGQYGRAEVERLNSEIGRAKLLHAYSGQEAIDQQVLALQDAIDAVIDSKVREEQRIFYDKVTGIYVIAPAGAVPGETTFIARRMGNNTNAFVAIRSSLREEESEAVYYSLGLFVGDERIQPSQPVEIQIPAPETISSSGLRICSVSGKGRLSDLPAQRAGDTLFFKTKWVGDYVLAGKPAGSDEKARARAAKFRELMKQRKAEQANQKVRELQKAQKKAEDYRDPVGRMLEPEQNDASFSADVRRQTNPAYLLLIAAALGAAGIAFAIRGFMDLRRRRRDPGE